jgi:death-on-curing family protein
MKTIIISIKEIEVVAFSLAKKLLRFDEPMPDFGTRFPHILESCLVTPFQRFGGKYLYEGLLKKSATLFYLMIKNHPFENGNKRVAMMTLLYLLYKNEKWIEVDNQVLYNFAKWVAASDPIVKSATVDAIEKFLSTHLVDRERQD